MRTRAILIAALGIVTCAGPVFAAGTAGPTVVPLHVERGPFGDPRLGIDVTLGSKTVRVLLDTGSVGLRILASAVPADAARRNGTSAAGGYASGIVLQGEQATARLSIGDPNVVESAVIELVDGISCNDQQPKCPAANGGTPEMFGALFPGIFGASNDSPPRGRCCGNPIEAFSEYGRRYIVHAKFDAPTITLGPEPTTLSNFTMIDVPRGLSPRGCIRIVGAPNDICGAVLFDTGAPAILVTTTGIVPQGGLSGELAATLTLGTWSHVFASGPRVPVRVTLRRGNQNHITIGLAALQSLDVYYDLAAGRMGFAAVE
jgi:hypothetical protein